MAWKSISPLSHLLKNGLGQGLATMAELLDGEQKPHTPGTQGL